MLVVTSCIVIICYVLFLNPNTWEYFVEQKVNKEDTKDVILSETLDGLSDIIPPEDIVDPINAYHAQVRSHAVWGRFLWLLSLYRSSWDLSLMPLLIQTWLQAGEYTVLREELTKLSIDSKEIAEQIGADNIIKTLFAVTPLSLKSYEPLKKVIDRYHTIELITQSQKDYYYSLIALAKWHRDDYEMFVQASAEQSSIALVERVTQSQNEYWYAPDRRGLGLYGVAAYESGWYRVSQNVSQILKKNDPRYLLGHQLEAWSSMKLHQRDRVEKATQKLASLDTDTNNYDSYRFMEAIASYESGDYARSIILFNQLDSSKYAYESVRYRFLIALENEEVLEKYIKNFEWYDMRVSDYYELISILYPPYSKPSQQTMQALNWIVKKCQSSIKSSYKYVCLMWKAWLLWQSGESEKALLILKQLTQVYPTTHGRELLWDIYYRLWQIKESKRAYIEALRFGSDDGDLESRVLPRIQ